MLFILDRNENIMAILEQGNKNACPYFDAKIKTVLNGEQILTFKVPFDHEDAKRIEELGFVAVQNKYKEWILFLITEIIEVHNENTRN